MESARSWTSWLRPSLAGFVLWLIFLWLNLLLFAGGGGTATMGPSGSQWSSYNEMTYGFPVVVRLWTKRNGDQPPVEGAEVFWSSIAVLLLASYAISMAAGRALIGQSQRGVGVRLALALASVVGLSFWGATAMSRAWWNYSFSRPDVLVPSSQVGLIESITPVISKNGQFVIDDAFDLQKQAGGDPTDGGYYNLEQRMLMALKEAGKLPAQAQTMEAAQLPSYRTAFLQSGLLARSDAGYDSAKDLHGNLIAFNDGHGSDLVFFGIRGGQVSNDHYPYYEAVFERQGERLRLLDSQMFYYDLAGMEGFEWQGMFLLLTLAGIPAALIALGIIESVMGKRAARRALTAS